LSGKVFIAGADADLAAIKSIVAGRQQLEVLKDIAPLAQTAAQVAFELAQGKTPAAQEKVENGGFEVGVIATPVYAVSKENIDERIIKTGFHPKSAVYGN